MLRTLPLLTASLLGAALAVTPAGNSTVHAGTPVAPDAAAQAAPAQTNATPSQLAELPEAISSFGAIVNGEYLYVYSGHTGRAHDHSRDNLSQHFRRLHLRKQQWEDLPMQRPLQGLALVSHGRHVYRVGGMEARNGAAELEDLHSTADFARFDTAAGTWESLPAMPSGRSSHDAVVVANTLYVVGGWRLAGDSDGDWYDTAWAVDLDKSPLQWRELPPQPFRRRALAAATADGRVYALCGMNEDHEVDRRVDTFDPATGQWEQVADLPGEGMNGFGIAAWNYQGAVHVSGSNGVVYRLQADGRGWHEVAQLAQPRFFHRLIPHPDGGLVALGGASRQGHLTNMEWLPLSKSSSR